MAKLAKSLNAFTIFANVPDNRFGRCYELAYDFVQEHPDFTLVHGITILEARGKAVGNHAWGEFQTLVYEPYTDLLVPRSFWNRYSFENSPPERFTAQEAKLLFEEFHAKDWVWTQRNQLPRLKKRLIS